MSSRKWYGASPCYVCQKPLTHNGGGYTSHFRKHVREGKMVEWKNREGYPQFKINKKCEECGQLLSAHVGEYHLCPNPAPP